MIIGGIETLIQVNSCTNLDDVFSYAQWLLDESADSIVHAVAIECLNIAARKGHIESQLFLCIRSGQNLFEYLHKNLLDHTPNELDRLALKDTAPWLEYRTFYLETEAEFQEAEELANDRENAYRFYCLGQACLNGDIVPLDLKEGFKWFLIAAELGFAPAQIQIALCYIESIGVEENRFIAQIILEKASNDGVEEAQELLVEEFGIEIKQEY